MLQSSLDKSLFDIVCVISLYNPSKSDLLNIASYANLVEYCVLMDDSEVENREKIADLLEAFPNRIEYRWNHGNIGLCKSVNKGIKYAMEMGANWILIMDQDSKMHNNIVNVFREYIDKNCTDGIALLAPRYNYDRHERSAKRGERRKHFANMSGSLINTKALSRIGLYDERFFIDGLDVEWCLRALRTGYMIVECSEAVLDHHPAETREIIVFGKTVFKYGQDSPTRYYYQFRAIYLIHTLYHDIRSDLFGIYKFLKSVMLFENKKAYIHARKRAKEDFRRGYFGKYYK